MAITGRYRGIAGKHWDIQIQEWGVDRSGNDGRCWNIDRNGDIESNDLRFDLRLGRRGRSLLEKREKKRLDCLTGRIGRERERERYMHEIIKIWVLSKMFMLTIRYSRI